MQFVSLRRRDLITLLAGSAAVWLHEAGAQQPGELPIVGYLGPNVESVDRPRSRRLSIGSMSLAGSRAAA